MSTEELARIERGELSILVWGRVTYTDAFKIDRYFDYDMTATGPLSSIRSAGGDAVGWASGLKIGRVSNLDREVAVLAGDEIDQATLAIPEWMLVYFLVVSH